MPATPGANNFPATIADMRDVYGLTSETPTQKSTLPSPSPSRVSSNSNSSRSSKSSSSFCVLRLLRKKERVRPESPTSVPSNTPSDSRRSSIDSQETLATPTSTSSTSKPQSAPRDYEAAFSALSSSYGFGGHGPTSVPVLPYTSSTCTTSHKKTDRSSSDTSSKMDEQTARLDKLASQNDARAEAVSCTLFLVDGVLLVLVYRFCIS